MVTRGNDSLQSVFTKEKRLELFRTVVEPTLQRGLKHKGSVSSEGSHAAELLGHIEIPGRLERCSEHAPIGETENYRAPRRD